MPCFFTTGCVRSGAWGVPGRVRSGGKGDGWGRWCGGRDMIAIVNYGAGNIKSVMFALQRLGAEAHPTASAAELAGAAGIILPGVGAFAPAMEHFRANKLDIALVELARAGKPLLGICLGHQLLFSESHEYGRHRGLGLIRGCVRRFRSGVKIPHMGWNQASYRKKSAIFEGVGDNKFFYFAHSFCVCPEEPGVTLTVTDYGSEFVSAVQYENIFGVQFHPEKSGESGLSVLMNFCRLCGEQ